MIGGEDSLSKEKITIFLKKSKAPEHIQRALDAIIYELEHYGRAITNNGSASRYLALKMRQPKNFEYIYFGWNKQNQKSMICLAHNVMLEKVNDNKIRITCKPK